MFVSLLIDFKQVKIRFTILNLIMASCFSRLCYISKMYLGFGLEVEEGRIIIMLFLLVEQSIRLDAKYLSIAVLCWFICNIL